MSTTDRTASTWRPSMAVMLVALVALVIGAAMIVLVGLHFAAYWTTTARIIALVILALIWLTALLAIAVLAREFARK